MRRNREEVFIDTSGFKALLDNEDEFHKKAIQIWERLRKEETSLLTTNYILDETFTLLRARHGIQAVLDFRDLLLKSSAVLKIERVTTKDEAAAWDWFTKDWSRLSFTDCVSFSLMGRLKIERVITFDIHFKKAGFKVEKV